MKTKSSEGNVNRNQKKNYPTKLCCSQNLTKETTRLQSFSFDTLFYAYQIFLTFKIDNELWFNCIIWYTCYIVVILMDRIIGKAHISLTLFVD